MKKIILSAGILDFFASSSVFAAEATQADSSDNTVAIAAIVISIGSLAITLYQAWHAKRVLKDNTLLSLFSGFDQANQAVLKNTTLLIKVHGLKKDDDLENIAYLAILIDAFHHYWGKEYDNKYGKVLKVFDKEGTNFIHKIVAVKENKARWDILKEINYGTSDNDFIVVMDKLFKEAERTPKEI